MAMSPEYRMTAARSAGPQPLYASVRFPYPSFSRFVFRPEHRRHLADHLGMTVGGRAVSKAANVVYSSGR